jgi:phospholipase/carboxylesterase
VLALSTFLPLADRLAAEMAPAARELPILVAHGTLDAVIPVARGRRAHDRLVEAGCRVSWREYPMAHAVCDAEIADAGAWLQEVLAADRG